MPTSRRRHRERSGLTLRPRPLRAHSGRRQGPADREALIGRSGRGKIQTVDWRALLIRWAADAPRQSRSAATMWLDARGISKLEGRLEELEGSYALTGSAAASRMGPSVAPTRLLSVYVDDAQAAANVLGLRAADRGANVMLLEPDDAAVFGQAVPVSGVRTAPLPFVVADLLGGTGREPNEAEALMRWMSENEENWRAR